MLVAHAGKVLTHRMLMSEVRGGKTDMPYLRIYVRRLRQKIEADPSGRSKFSPKPASHTG